MIKHLDKPKTDSEMIKDYKYIMILYYITNYNRTR